MTQDAHHARIARDGGAQFEACVSRLIDATSEAVFDAFVSADAQAQWFAGPGDRVISLVVDARVGGAWDAVFEHEGVRYAWTGTFTEVERPHRFSVECVNTHPGAEPFPSTFTVTCEPRGAQTSLTVTEVHVSERRRDDALGGLPGMIDVIQRVAEQEAASS